MSYRSGTRREADTATSANVSEFAAFRQRFGRRFGCALVCGALAAAIFPTSSAFASLNAPAVSPTKTAEQDSSLLELAQNRRAFGAAERPEPPQRGSSAMLEGGSSADRYGGSSADRSGVAGSRDSRYQGANRRGSGYNYRAEEIRRKKEAALEEANQDREDE
ncbi:MAG: hypothetical protein ABR587_10220 [Candidatus Binatia bacterium]